MKYDANPPTCIYMQCLQTDRYHSLENETKEIRRMFPRKFFGLVHREFLEIKPVCTVQYSTIGSALAI
jgi:hypothetical protein